MRCMFAGHALEARWVCVHGALGVYARPQSTNTQRMPSVCSARAPRVSGVGPTRSAHVWRPSVVYIYASSSLHICVHAQKSRRTQRTTTNAWRWSSALDERVAHADAHPANDDARAVRRACVTGDMHQVTASHRPYIITGLVLYNYKLMLHDCKLRLYHW